MTTTTNNNQQPGRRPRLLAAPGGGPHNIADLTVYLAGLAGLTVPAFLNIVASWLEPRWIAPDLADEIQAMIGTAALRLGPEARIDLSTATQRWIPPTPRGPPLGGYSPGRLQSPEGSGPG